MSIRVIERIACLALDRTAYFHPACAREHPRLHAHLIEMSPFSEQEKAELKKHQRLAESTEKELWIEPGDNDCCFFCHLPLVAAPPTASGMHATARQHTELFAQLIAKYHNREM